VATDDVTLLSMRSKLGTILVVNSFAFRQVSATAGDQRAALAQDWDTQIMPTWVTGISNTWTVTDYAMTAVDPAGGAEVVVSPAATRVGNDSSDPLPPQSAQVITLRTGIAGRSYRGRVFTAGLAESSQSAGTYTAGWMTNRLAVRNLMFGRYITNKSTTGWEIGVISRQLNGVVRPTPVFTPLTDIQYQSLVKRMSSRMIGHGA